MQAVDQRPATTEPSPNGGRRETRPIGSRLPVLLALDDSPASRAAHRWAAAYAQAMGTVVRAVHVLEWPIGLSSSAVKSGTRLHVPRQDVAEPYWRGMQRVFEEFASPPGSGLLFAQGDVGDVLVRLAGQAGLLVIGTQEPSTGARFRRGSLSHYCVSRATCPVVTVPPADGAVRGPAPAAP